jgi:putative transcriptional regulator
MRFPIPPTPDEMRSLRRKVHMSQSQMANLLNTPKKTYQNWEQGLRKPDGAITLLLNLLRKEPKVVKLLMEA